MHFTESMALRGGYKYSNKPGGIRHWLAHASPPIAERFVALIDPDMLLLRPLTVALAEGLAPSPRAGRAGGAKQSELADARSGVGRVLAQRLEVLA